MARSEVGEAGATGEAPEARARLRASDPGSTRPVQGSERGGRFNDMATCAGWWAGASPG